MDAQREIEALVGFEGRLAGSDAERRAAEHLARRLQDLGREAEVEPISVYPNYALAHLLHALLAVTGSLISVGSPLIGALIVAFAALSTVGDLTGTLFLIRRLTGRRASQNVLSREDRGKPGTLILVAHYDAARGGSLFDRRVVERRATLSKRLRLPIGLGGGFVVAVLAILACTALRLVGLESTVLSIVQFVPTALLVAAMPLLADLQLSPPSPGAADNAAGVATAMRVATDWANRLEHLDLWVLLTGAEEGMALGMREWLQRHRSELTPGAAVFVNLDKAGYGTVRFTTREGPALGAPTDPELVAICEDIAAEDEEGGRFGARPLVARATSDALAARSRGYRAITVSCLGSLDYQPNQHQPTDTPDRIDPDALERAFGFAGALIERIDAQIGPEIARAEAEP